MCSGLCSVLLEAIRSGIYWLRRRHCCGGSLGVETTVYVLINQAWPESGTPSALVRSLLEDNFITVSFQVHHPRLLKRVF
jgi:hypothetical protein